MHERNLFLREIRNHFQSGLLSHVGHRLRHGRSIDRSFCERGRKLRHPSELYEFALEGMVMFTVLVLFSRKPRPRYAVSGLFALMYGVFRFAVEFVRVPDAQVGYLFHTGWLTEGQLLSMPLVLLGIALLWLSRRSPIASAPAPLAPATNP